MSIILLVDIGAKLIGPHGGLQVGKKTVPDEQAPWSDPTLKEPKLKFDKVVQF